jgi:hypothetical protein
MTRASNLNTGDLSPGHLSPGHLAVGDLATDAGTAMSFSVDGWDPSYGASLELERQLEESTATVTTDVELPGDRWRPIDPDETVPLPAALLFVDGVRRVEAQVWIDGAAPLNGSPDHASPDHASPDHGAQQVTVPDYPAPYQDAQAAPGIPSEPTAALCASYAAGVVCCCSQGAHLVVAELRRGLFTVAPHASDILTRAGRYTAHPMTSRRPNVPVMTALSILLQGELSAVEKTAAADARGAVGDASHAGSHASHSGRHAASQGNDLLIIDGPLRHREHLPRALGYIKSHHMTYLPPELNALVGRLVPGQRTPAFLVSGQWDRHSWYLRLPGPAGAPWSGVVRIECPADLPAAEVTRLAGLSQRCLGKFASAPYKDSRAPQNLYPIAGLERELRRRLGDPQLLYRALREAARPHA